MNIIESFLERVQTEKLDVKEIVKKSNKLFLRTYKKAVQDCIVKQKTEEYWDVKPDMICEQKAQLIAYKALLSHLDKWVKHCKDAYCKQSINAQRSKIQSRYNFLQHRKPINKPLPKLEEFD